MQKEEWELVPTPDINQMLKMRQGINQEHKNGFSELLIVKHQYSTSDDVLFPELSTLGYLNSFEQQGLYPLEKQGALQFVATDIAKGKIHIYLYCKQAKEAMMECIQTLLKMPLFKVEFEIKKDATWSTFDSLRS